jgi:pimeloyl-ACP methyl ester carboxylesterase
MKTRIAFCAALLALAVSCTVAHRPVTVPLAGGGSLFVDDGGRGGVPILFVHGNGGNSQQWKAQLEHFRGNGRRAIAIDLPGFGTSTAPADGDYSLDAMAGAIDRAVTAIHLDRFVIAGHSYGGAVVAKYAATHPDKVAGVIYVDAAAAAVPLNDEQKNQFRMALQADRMKVVRAWFAPMLKPSQPSVSEAVFASVERSVPEAFIGALLSLTSYDAKALVDAYHGPRLAIVASELETPASFQKQFPAIETVPIANAGHWLMLDKPEEVNAAIDSFLARLRSQGTR